MNSFFLFTASILVLSVGKEISNISRDNSQYDVKEGPHLVDFKSPIYESILQEARIGALNQYWLYTRLNPNNHQTLIHGNASSIFTSFYSTKRPSTVIVHGLTDSGHSNINVLLISSFLNVQDFNVIVVDWSAVSAEAYTTASTAVPSIGQHLGNFLNWLFNTAGGDWNNLHLVGFSLGAHIVGVAGRTAGGRAARVTGLDPAGPLWINNSEAINILSGQYVEGIHTDGGVLGVFKPVGHADFYPNGGVHPQPGCFTHDCSHRRAYQFFAQSVHTDQLIGCECSINQYYTRDSCSGNTLHFGNANVNKTGRGIFCLRIRRVPL